MASRIARVPARRLILFNRGGATESNWWDSIGLTPWADYRPYGAASFAASLVDQTGQGHDAGDPGGSDTPDWTAAAGWDFDGASHLTTEFLPELNGSQAVFVQFTDLSGADKFYIAGCQTTTGTRFGIRPQLNSVTFYNCTTGDYNTCPAAGNLAFAGSAGYLNGSPVVTGLTHGGSGDMRALWISALNLGNAHMPQIWKCRQFTIFDVAPNATQAAAIAAAMAALCA